MKPETDADHYICSAESCTASCGTDTMPQWFPKTLSTDSHFQSNFPCKPQIMTGTTVQAPLRFPKLQQEIKKKFYWAFLMQPEHRKPASFGYSAFLEDDF